MHGLAVPCLSNARRAWQARSEGGVALSVKYFLPKSVSIKKKVTGTAQFEAAILLSPQCDPRVFFILRMLGFLVGSFTTAVEATYALRLRDPFVCSARMRAYSFACPRRQ